MTAKPKTKSPAVPKASASLPRKMPRKMVILIIIGVLVLTVIFAILSYRTQESKRSAAESLAADKAAFAQVEAEMARAYEGIVAAVGEPDSERRIKSCDRISHKLDDSDLHCAVGYAFSYLEEGIIASHDRTDRLEASLQQYSQFKPNDETSMSKDISILDNSSKSDTKTYKNSNDMSCELRYAFAPQRQTVERGGKEFQSSYIFRCDKPVNTPLYTLAE